MVQPPVPTYILDHKARNKVIQRIKNTAFTKEHGRSPKDVVNLRGMLTMEDVLHFYESVAPFAFRNGILSPKVSWRSPGCKH